MSHMCHNEALLTAYLYDECDEADRARVEEHLARCATCRAELDGLRAVRRHLSAWSPPVPGAGAIPFGRPVPPTAGRGRRALWGLAAAAVLVLAAAAAVATVEIRYGPDGLVVRAGRSAAEPAPAADAGPAPWREDIASLERRLREEVAVRPVADAPAPAVDDADLLRRVRLLIEESERRQQRELASRLATVLRDLDAQRRADLMQVQQGLGRLEGQTGAEMLQQRQLMNYLMRVSQRE